MNYKIVMIDLAKFIIVIFFLGAVSCGDGVAGYDLPDSCRGRCHIADDAGSFHDAVLSSQFDRTGCICVDGVLKNVSVSVGDGLSIIGRQDSTSEIVSDDTALHIIGDSVLISSLGIRSGTETGVDIRDADNVRIQNCTVYGAMSDGVFATSVALRIRGGSDITVADSVFLPDADETGGTAFGVVAEGVDGVSFQNVCVDGAGRRGTAGMNIISATAVLNDVTIQSVTEQGVLVRQSTVSGSGLQVENLRARTAGLYIDGGTVTLSGVDIKGVRMSIEDAAGGFGILAAGTSADITLSDVNIDDCDNAGVLIDDVSDINVSKISVSHCVAGVWAQYRRDSGSLRFSDVFMERNHLSGIYLLDPCHVTIENAIVSASRRAPYMERSMGDGIVLAGLSASSATCELTFDDVLLSENERAGMIIDGMSSDRTMLNAVKLREVKVRGDSPVGSEAERFGVVFQNGLEPDGIRSHIIENDFNDNDLGDDVYLGVLYERRSF